ncbi:hypothetical protein QJQ45_009302 [Haematococcus lacustris]|nr:hypothetical protein QJQ45_009302 [Haematococcus lacustris]
MQHGQAVCVEVAASAKPSELLFVMVFAVVVYFREEIWALGTDVSRHPIMAYAEQLQIKHHLGTHWLFGTDATQNTVDVATALVQEDMAKAVVKAVNSSSTPRLMQVLHVVLLHRAQGSVLHDRRGIWDKVAEAAFSVAPCILPQPPCSSQKASQPAASEHGPSTPPPAKRSKRSKRSKRTKADQAAEPTRGKGKAQGKAANAKPAPNAGRVSFDHYWSEEARALKASALAGELRHLPARPHGTSTQTTAQRTPQHNCGATRTVRYKLHDLVNAFAGVPDVVTLHAGLPSTDSFPLLTICASSLPHSQQACQVPTAAASVPESAQPTGAATIDCASSHTASRQAPLALHLGPGLAGSNTSLYSSAFCQQSDSGAASACLSEDDVTPSLAPESEISEGLLGLPKLAPVATAQPTDPALPDVQAKLGQQAAGQQAAGLVVDRQPESEKPPARVLNASPACEPKEQGSAGADAGAGRVSGASSVEADAQEGGQIIPQTVPPSLGSSLGSGPEVSLPLLSAAGLPPVTISIGGQLVFDAQQYMFHSGHAPLRQWATDIVQHCHAPPLPFHTAITSGAVHALNAAIACLCDKGDFVVCEEFAYTHAPECIFIPRGLIMLPVALDEHGMVPDSLRRVLASHPASPVTGKAPRILYIIPSGQNPTGSVMPLERKQLIYEICREHNMLILEDDAYYWLQYPGGALPAAQQPGLQLPPSFLSLDTDGRVLRIDTFSKLLGPGYRLGWVSGAPALVAKIAQAIQGSSCGSCPLAQVIVAQLLQAWGRAGFTAFVQQQQALYARRAAVAAAAARQHLAGLATWASPSAGMFMWFRLTGLPDVDTRLLAQLVQQRVVVVPGRPFWTDIALAKGGAPCPFFRVTYGAVPEQDIEVGFARLAAAIRGVLTQAAGEDLETVAEAKAAMRAPKQQLAA